MKTFHSSAYALGALLAISLLCGCGSSTQPAASIPMAQSMARPPLVGAGKVSPDQYVQRLYVTDVNASTHVLDNAYNWLDDITGNTPCPSGAWMTRVAPKRLFVANFGCNGIPEVTEFKNLNTAPYGTFDFSYNATLVDPITATTDNALNVYVADLLGSQVVEYSHHHNVVLNHCSSPGGNSFVSGVAVDAAGDVFVAAGTATHIIEYPGPAGLSGCNGVTLSATIPGQPADLILDNNANLIECNHSAVYKIAGPAYSAAVQIATTAAFQCLHLSLNAAGNHLFISEPFKSPPDIQIIKYPNGLVLSPILPSTNVPHPVGVAAYPG